MYVKDCVHASTAMSTSSRKVLNFMSGTVYACLVKGTFVKLASCSCFPSKPRQVCKINKNKFDNDNLLLETVETDAPREVEMALEQTGLPGGEL